MSQSTVRASFQSAASNPVLCPVLGNQAIAAHKVTFLVTFIIHLAAHSD